VQIRELGERRHVQVITTLCGMRGSMYYRVTMSLERPSPRNSSHALFLLQLAQLATSRLRNPVAACRRISTGTRLGDISYLI
jgi:hypothetical protein